MSWDAATYEEWCKRLGRCPRTLKVSWPSRFIANLALPAMVQRAIDAGLECPEPAVYRCTVLHGCRLYHLTRDADRANRKTRSQVQRENQPDTYREKRARQRRNRRLRDKEAKHRSTRSED